jgi:hypothetical protein
MFIAGDVETVTRLRPPARDPFGDQVGGLAELDVAGCLVAPGGSAEIGEGEGARQVDTDATVYAPPGTAVASTDRMRVRGLVYEVIGVPQQWGTTGVVIQLRRVTG